MSYTVCRKHNRRCEGQSTCDLCEREQKEQKPPDITLKARDDPEANGRTPQPGDERWTIHIPLESGATLHVLMGRQSRDNIFGMMIADYHDSDEPELT